MEARPGGVWRFVQHAADGSEYAFNGVYREVVPPERIVDTFEFEGLPGHAVVETVTFEERGGLTTVRTLSRFATVEDRDGMIQSGMEEGAAERIDRLAELLKTMG
ncbi:MAG: polyketide cyclase [Anaerolineales bacterium]|nr:polyketide cyclase [Anaerolineales bacterium]